ncbi:MAG TPA: DUF397 domain-containing protein [Streptosporangiaceae bacterium]|nr:DUF397 domain-containing protein [Streptosporangiaceae bacterium]
MINVDHTGRVWRKATYSNAGVNCVEVAVVPAGVAIRDSKNPDKPFLNVSVAAFAAFIGGIKDGGV